VLRLVKTQSELADHLDRLKGEEAALKQRAITSVQRRPTDPARCTTAHLLQAPDVSRHTFLADAVLPSSQIFLAQHQAGRISGRFPVLAPTLTPPPMGSH
jgi:hypothetical protein